MILLIILFGVFTASLIINWKSPYGNDPMLLVALMSGIILLISSLSVATNYFNTEAKVEEFKAVESTIEVMRSNTEGTSMRSDLEIVALQQQIIDSNKWLAGAKYRNSICDICIPDKVLNLKPLE